jgi:hypothetical protein
MARELTVDELDLLRSDMQGTKLYLAFFRPNVIYTAHLASVPSSTDRVYQIGFNSGVGTLANVMPNMTLYVGTSAGAYDLGMCRIRKAPIAGTFYIGLTSEINWAAGGTIYLTVVDDFDLWAKHATIASDVLAMDVDTAYSDQHSSFSPVPILGTHAVVWLDEATVDVEFDGSDSWVIGSSITGHVWTAPGSSASSGLTTATPTITYNAPGCYSVYDTVTAANGKSTVGVRHVFVYDRDENQPSTVFQLSQCIGDHDTGGWMFDMTMEAEASLSEIRDRELVALFAEDWYGPEWVNQSIGPVENRENIVCVGRIVGESIRWDRESGLVHFTVQGLQHWLSRIKAFPVELSFVGSATDWTGMPALNVDRVLWHILYWHSTALETMDFTPTNDTRYAADGKTIASNIWGQLNDIAFSKLLAVPGVDRFGRLFVEVDPQMVAEADRDFPEVMQLTDDDWAEALDFSRVIVQDCSLISLNAEEVNSAGTSVTRYSLSPGHVPERYGEPEMMDRALCASQAQSNALAGLLLGWRTNQYPDLPVTLAQNNRMIDVFPRQTCGIVVEAGDTPREIALDLQLIPRRVAFYFDADTGYFHTEINFEGETVEQISTNGDIPDTDEIAMETPPIPSLPSLPDLPVLLPGLDTDTSANVGPRKVLVHDPVAGLLLSVNFNTASPTWIQVNAGLTTTQYQKINKVLVCPNGAVYVANMSGGVDSFLARAPYIGATFTLIEDYASIQAKYGSTDNIRVCALNCNRLVSESVLYCLSQAGENVKTYLGFGSTFTAKATFTINTNNNADVSYGLGAWLFTADGFVRLSADASSVAGTGTISGAAVGTSKHSRIVTSGETIHWRGGSNDLILGHNNCASFTTGLASDLDAAYLYEDKVTHDVTGRYIMTRNASGPNPVKSSDGGFSFSVIGTLPTLVNWYFANISAVQWIAVSSYIYFTDDFGVSAWHDKRGNILSLAPLLACDVVKVIQY